MIRVLQLDSGGAKGVIQITILKELEKQLGKPLYEVFDLIVGSSVGAIIGGVISSGKMSAVEADDVMVGMLPDLFKHRLRIPLIQPIYDRKPFVDIFNAHIGAEKQMKDCMTKFMCTAVSKTDGRTHFYKSWEEEDGKLNLLQAVLRSFAAPMFFGAIKDKPNKQVWLDGATGNATCTLLEAMIECMRQKWVFNPEGIHILSLGCGHVSTSQSYKDACRWGNISDVLYYMQPSDGGLARKQAIRSRVELANQIEETFDKFTFQRLDTQIPKKMHKMDGIKYIKNYQEFGRELAEKLELQYFRG